MRAGRIELYSWDGGLLVGYNYVCVADRKREVEIWKRRYSFRFSKCYFQITPSVDIDRLKENGQNDSKGPKRKHRLREDNLSLAPMRKCELREVEMVGFRRGSEHPNSLKRKI